MRDFVFRTCFVICLVLTLGLGCARTGYHQDANDSDGTTTHDGSRDDVSDGALEDTLSGPDMRPDGSGDGNPGDVANAADVLTSPCGNGMVDPEEECDDGNVRGSDGCSQGCVLEDQGPGGDLCLNPKRLTLVPIAGGRRGGIARGDTSSATSAAQGTCAGTSGLAPDRIYQVTLAETSDLSVSLLTPFDAVLYVRGFGGSACTDGAAEVGCADNVSSGQEEGVTLPGLLAGTYFIVVDGFEPSASGTYTLQVTTQRPGP